jgi:hypothetical protein
MNPKNPKNPNASCESLAAAGPCYVMGAFAQLQLGADALNLAGARSGSVLIARALLDREGAR